LSYNNPICWRTLEFLGHLEFACGSSNLEAWTKSGSFLTVNVWSGLWFSEGTHIWRIFQWLRLLHMACFFGRL
jgi:hypothetical protein